ncbi:PREDICTED: uncharacterized protein LOC109584859 [Amphimedon queenslandica]|uniref:Uncharacterized protein n=1 Tax=Amphimedon queenslandica TaxID=400682 RepID=A0A1X7U3L2_AMPQE|nr:PREDICTED: uncharacterized protein LOC109584859 [Amphimedon queenslandica]|eukprot:XP_019856313.1 PREDICTED: uncharacterized protein LOC109584859 [Amphimedon queenslandica]
MRYIKKRGTARQSFTSVTLKRYKGEDRIMWLFSFGAGTTTIGIALVICSYVLPIRSFIRTDIDIENIMFLAGIILIIGLDSFRKSLEGTALFFGGLLLAYFCMYQVHALYIGGLAIAVIGLYLILKVSNPWIVSIIKQLLNIPSIKH